MALPEFGKRYLIVFCKSCDKGFRVVDSAIEPGQNLRLPPVALKLKCRGCGHEEMYSPQEMRTATVGPKPTKRA